MTTPGIPLTAASAWTPFSGKIRDKQEELREAEARRASLQKELNALAASFLRAEHAHEATEHRIVVTRRKLRATQNRLRAGQNKLSQRLNTIYRNGQIGLAEVLLGANSFSDLLTRLDILTRLGSSDAGLVASISRYKRLLSEEKDRLHTESVIEKRQMNRMELAASRLNKAIAAQTAQAQTLEGQIADLQRQEKLAIIRQEKARLERIRRERERLQRLQRAREARLANASFANGRHGSSGRRVRVYGLVIKRGGYVFPVAGPHAFSDTFGAPRSGGRRHKGADIFSRYGTPLVAVTSGSVRRSPNGLGGLSVWLRGRDGNCYYYAHLSRYGRSGRVSAGTVIGYNGNSGNARGTSPHVHFEIHPGCGGAVNPTPYLRSWD